MYRSLPIFLISIFIIVESRAEVPHKRFEYKFSFKPPYLAQRDGSVPFWIYGGNAIASADNIRLAQSLKSQKGAIRSREPINFEWWEVDITFRVFGRSRIGADGMAFWYTTGPHDFDGTVFGNPDRWNGLGIFFDSFDNDNKHNNPYIMAITNDGTKVFDHANDGSTQMLSGCLRDFRNKPFSTRAKIEYYKNTLTVLFHNGNTQNENDFEVCLRVENVVLPRNGHFGLSAATGGLADDHDVKQFLTHSLHPPGTVSPHGDVEPPRSEEQQKLTDEYAEYQRKLDIQKEQYKKEHPEAQKEDEGEFGEWFESDSQRELRQVFQVQTQMYEAIRVLGNKLDEVIGRQERTLSMLSAVPGNIHGAAGVPPVQHQIPESARIGMPPGGLDSVINAQKELFKIVSDLRAMLIDVSHKADSVLTNQARQPTAQVQSIGYDNSAVFREMQEGLNAMRRDVTFTAQKVAATQQVSCPNVQCPSAMVLVLIALVQVVMLVGYFIYRDNKESYAKKFY